MFGWCCVVCFAWLLFVLSSFVCFVSAWWIRGIADEVSIASFCKAVTGTAVMARSANEEKKKEQRRRTEEQSRVEEENRRGEGNRSRAEEENRGEAEQTRRVEAENRTEESREKDRRWLRFPVRPGCASFHG